uniref:Ycf34 n=1 Tax=Cyanoptyche gloeocystis TaxID=77922 RepID=A0A3G1IWI2_9EUKA|nr:hypothetical protein Ycf34 [Cyanoptyche gloeocystis]
MCICLNCDYISKCKLYNAIEHLHLQQIHKENNFVFFEPRGVEIAISITNTKNTSETEWDIRNCESFITNTNKLNINLIGQYTQNSTNIQVIM